MLKSIFNEPVFSVLSNLTRPFREDIVCNFSRVACYEMLWIAPLFAPLNSFFVAIVLSSRSTALFRRLFGVESSLTLGEIIEVLGALLMF